MARITGGVLYVAEPSDPSWAQGPRDPWLTTAQVAEITQMSPATWRSQVRRGYAPKADDPGDLDVSPRRRNPRWRRSTVALYLAKRRPRLKKPQAESAQ